MDEYRAGVSCSPPCPNSGSGDEYRAGVLCSSPPYTALSNDNPDSCGGFPEEGGVVQLDLALMEVSRDTEHSPAARHCGGGEEACTGSRNTTPGSVAHAGVVSGARSTPPTSGDCEEVLVGGGTPPASKKPRGRPKGSKNKPKPAVVITQRDETAMHAAVVEVLPGADVVGAVREFSVQRRVGVAVMGAYGRVSNVVVRHSGTTPSCYALQGVFDIVNLSGTCLPPPPAGAGQQLPSGFGISVAGPQGVVYGGAVGGDVAAAGPVVVMVATFGSAEYRRVAPPSPELHAEGVDAEQQEVDVKPLLLAGGESSHQIEAYGGLCPGTSHHQPGMQLLEVTPPWRVGGHLGLRRQHF